jgi:hypothetical protein
MTLSEVVVITPPAPILDLALVKKHIRVDDDDSDDLIAIFSAAAQAALDCPGGWLGRAVGVQTLELRLNAFPFQNWGFGLEWTMWGDGEWETWSHPQRFARIKLPYPPFIAVTSITYEDVNGVDQVLSSSGWAASDEGVTPAFGDVWPAGRIDANAVRIQYQAGYTTPPPPIVAAMLLTVGDLWENRAAQVIDARAVVAENPTVANLLNPYRIYSAGER